jgi:hypothetical protein
MKIKLCEFPIRVTVGLFKTSKGKTVLIAGIDKNSVLNLIRAEHPKLKLDGIQWLNNDQTIST